MVTLETERLILRSWKVEDAAALFKYAKNPLVGPAAGWAPHINEEDSCRIIREVLSDGETYALILKSTMEPVGCAGLMSECQSNISIKPGEGEIGYWIGVPFWGMGLVPEAVRELIRHGFEDLKLTRIWSGYYDGNIKSQRVQEKCGFQYHHTEAEKLCVPLDEKKTLHVSFLDRDRWVVRATLEEN